MRGRSRRAGDELGGAEAKQHEGLAAFIAGVPVERERLYQCRSRLLEALEEHQRVAEPGEGLGAVSRRHAVGSASARSYHRASSRMCPAPNQG